MNPDQPTSPPSSAFDLDHAKTTNPILHVIPYTSSFSLYRFPPNSLHAPQILAQALTSTTTSTQRVPPPSSTSEGQDEEEKNVDDDDDVDSIKSAGEGFLTITKTKEEISLMVESNSIVNRSLKDLVREEEGGVEDGPFGCLRIRGPMELNLIGIASRLLIPLTKAGISVFIISSYDTDFIFLAKEHLDRAGKVLKEDGWVVL